MHRWNSQNNLSPASMREQFCLSRNPHALGRLQGDIAFILFFTRKTKTKCISLKLINVYLIIEAIKIWDVIADGLTREELSHYAIVFFCEPESIATRALKLKSQWAFTRTNSRVLWCVNTQSVHPAGRLGSSKRSLSWEDFKNHTFYGASKNNPTWALV